MSVCFLRGYCKNIPVFWMKEPCPLHLKSPSNVLYFFKLWKTLGILLSLWNYFCEKWFLVFCLYLYFCWLLMAAMRGRSLLGAHWGGSGIAQGCPEYTRYSRTWLSPRYQIKDTQIQKYINSKHKYLHKKNIDLLTGLPGILIITLIF